MGGVHGVPAPPHVTPALALLSTWTAGPLFRMGLGQSFPRVRAQPAVWLLINTHTLCANSGSVLPSSPGRPSLHRTGSIWEDLPGLHSPEGFASVTVYVHSPVALLSLNDWD